MNRKEKDTEKSLGTTIDIELQKRFKAAAAARGWLLKTALADAMERWIALSADGLPAKSPPDARVEYRQSTWRSGRSMIKVETLPEELQECVRKLDYVLSRQQPEAIAALLTNVAAFHKLTVLSEGLPSDQHPATRSDIAIQEDLEEAIGELGESAEKRETGGA